MRVYRFKFAGGESGQASHYIVVARTLKDAQKKVSKSGEKREPVMVRLVAGKFLP